VPRPATAPHDRILDAATSLFYEEGVQVGINRIIARAEVTPTTLYRHFGSKDKLVAAALEQWGTEWLRWLRHRVDRPGTQSDARLEALWDALDQWFASDGFRGSLIANAAAGLGGYPDHPAQAAIAGHRMALRRFLEDLASGVGAREPSGLAAELQVLLDGAVAMAAVDRRPAVVAGVRALAKAAVGPPRGGCHGAAT
jgi:AcrR family transcriptional regulator